VSGREGECSALRELRQGFPVVVEIPVAWGEMDAYGHVNNIVFFRYFETARIAYFQETAVTPGRWDQEKVGRILAQTSCRFRVPLVYPDTVHVGARISQLGSDRFIMRYRVVSEALEKVVADGEALVVAFDYANNCKTELYGEGREAIAELEGQEPLPMEKRQEDSQGGM